ncbi:hypothetical protein K7I13_05675 [Brucepastera parasyntrophica]|uniref:hypothetical protein n=1 Tax=Brucepastera parasyntrophica TaxID=2880008 RepID=UPI00210DBE07|nr:hypothetical protein [Brucepastera parasyntrophica]ULQ60758.1 hypothetical protein K7I13_05675 [Brucepastera parasyntrophica]
MGSSGVFNMADAASVAADNEVYLTSGRYITVTGALTEPDVATIAPSGYTSGTMVVQGSSGHTLDTGDVGRFSLAGTGTLELGVGTYGTIQIQ